MTFGTEVIGNNSEAMYCHHRDDASIYSKRQRSNSMSSVSQQQQQTRDSFIQNLIVPSPTTADYLRNRTRKNFNVTGHRTNNQAPEDFELSQILYDDMAYRQLRKDSDAYKLSQMKAMPNNYHAAYNRLTPLTNITTLPLGHNCCDSGFNNGCGNGTGSNYSNVKTVRMLKQRDATNKTYKQSLINSSHMNKSYSSETTNR